MLWPVARDSAMVPSFHVRSGADRRDVMGRDADDPKMTTAGEDTMKPPVVTGQPLSRAPVMALKA